MKARCFQFGELCVTNKVQCFPFLIAFRSRRSTILSVYPRARIFKFMMTVFDHILRRCFFYISFIHSPGQPCQHSLYICWKISFSPFLSQNCIILRTRRMKLKIMDAARANFKYGLGFSGKLVSVSAFSRRASFVSE